MNGFDNEFNFVTEFNNKKIKDLSPLFRQVIDDIYYKIDGNRVIKAWKNHLKQKGDIILSIDGIIKTISIKMGSKNSVHVEHINEFCNFLYELNAPESLVNSFLKFHFADGTLNGSGKERKSTEQYKIIYQNEINKINDFFNTPKIMSAAIRRFVLQGIVSEYEIDGIIYGTPNDFLWIKKSDIIEILMLNMGSACSTVHFGPLVCQPLNRCLNYNNKYNYGRYYVQIKWYSLFDNIIERYVV